MTKGEQRSVMLAGPSFAAGPPSSSCDLGAGRGGGAVLGMERHLWPLAAECQQHLPLALTTRSVLHLSQVSREERTPWGTLVYSTPIHEGEQAASESHLPTGLPVAHGAACPPLRWCHFHAAPCALHPTGPAGSREPVLVKGRLCPLLLPEGLLPHCLPEPERCCRAWDLCRLPWRR